MNIVIYIFGITILFMGGTDSLIEDAKTDNNQQWILLRKLQNFQEAKPLTWNEVLADVLVNKIRIFSFKTEDKDDVIKDDTPATKEKTILTDILSKVFLFYKKFFYDTFVVKRKGIDDNVSNNPVAVDPNSAEEENPFELEEVINPTEVAFAGPKSEVELIEPEYYGKIMLGETTTTEKPGNNNDDPGKRDSMDVNVKETAIPDVLKNAESHVKANIDPGKEESVVNCAEGFVEGENGNCVISRLMLAVPSQCPIGYRKDRLGFCRLIFNF